MNEIFVCFSLYKIGSLDPIFKCVTIKKELLRERDLESYQKLTRNLPETYQKLTRMVW